ncbi:Holliday junction DNA helicase RuvA [Candidatus Peregrinibacteria bacterium RIFCSPLOWO2_02_FULL_39_10]|nr:MAG: Holliday junction DNA helicase RuvA [Candidatus Peregrinibacteria bacterium RIFCSPLOWO2_02_FULL_39_10]
MIAYLKGKILKKTDRGIILSTGNIGYFVHISSPLLETKKDSGEAEFFIHSHIREDAFDLYGFKTWSELNFFKDLISINGVGPKLAMEIFNLPIEKIKSAIINEDTDFICEIRGIGQKTSKRIVLELKSKIEKENIENLDASYNKEFKNLNSDAIEALSRLGYDRKQIAQTIRTMPKDITKAEEIITYFLKNI